MRRRRVQHEHREQCQLVQWLRMLRLPIVAPINGTRLDGNRRARAMQWFKLRRLGASAGVPDLLVCSTPLVAIEMKRPDGKGEVAPEQEAWHETLRAFGWHVIVAHGFDDARRQIEALGYGRRRA